ncbi:NOT2 / NOT3 / NOT5 family domain-containing protein [Hirsutella rhossiliensis]|uniref:General negative regulator of transcription subunit n=1 Tax=Hirsutella rhossiliensis TaxID=111463 RepID=A0A9P8MPC1_9HYPO|nr:NOT2 / NOT3 / NOT5 family domain-containing protein [Hirsutella rhossiliensis]KAH0958064.1 NOT2 / NOT3 / NOT5 family domain-containing protein [Hirsutella rhossiliensis]
MAARKLQQEVDKCFKKVAEGVAEFEAIYEKIEQSNNPAQKEKLEDNLKREIKKLQRLRDQIKTWAASNDIKDKAPLLEHRKLIETQMEKFKAVEKAMKTKAYSKEGLSAAAKLDPKEQAKVEAGEFLSSMVDELEQQIEALEAEGESIQATMKKGKNHGSKADRMAEIERTIEQHKWHQGKLELIRRSLENGGIETEQVNELEENIRYYVSDGLHDESIHDEEMYDDLNLDDDEGDEAAPEVEQPAKPATRRSQREVDTAGSGSGGGAGRKVSVPIKSPLPALATLHTPLSTISTGITSGPTMKPAAVPTRPAGEGLKYASAAAAAAASDRNNVGIAPLPPPPGSASVVISPLPLAQAKTSATSSPATTSVQPIASAVAAAAGASSQQAEPRSGPSSAGKQPAAVEPTDAATVPQANGATNGIKPIAEEPEEECIYHLPSSLQDLVDSYETARKRPLPPSASPPTLRMMTASQASCPEALDSEVPRTYRPDMPVPQTGSGFPREPLPIFDDPRLYSRIDPDTLFYVFYYKQGTAQQYLAAKALKDQSWRFHKQYQTWFQRHEEPKNITEEHEQGTYRFFDYESTWMNRRKADFRFAYKFLEDDI